MTISALEYARLAANVYGVADLVQPRGDIRSLENTMPLPSGWSLVSSIDDHDRIDGMRSTGFMAGVYTNGIDIVISFAGTTDESLSDWAYANAPAATAQNLASQIVQAADLYIAVASANPNKPISFTGHSLGGGLASLMSVYFDRPASVFDQAFFVRSADSSVIRDALIAALQADGKVVPEALLSYVAGGEPDVNGVIPSSPTRVERQGQVQQYSIQKEVLSFFTPDQIAAIAADLKTTAIGLGIAFESLFNVGEQTVLKLLARAYLQSKVADMPEAELIYDGLDLQAIKFGEVTITLSEFTTYVQNMGKVGNGSGTVYDLNAKYNSDLHWGYGLGTLVAVPGGIDYGVPNPVDLHSMTLLLGVMESPAFLSALRAHPELLPAFFRTKTSRMRPRPQRQTFWICWCSAN